MHATSTILLVEDDDDDAELILYAFNKAGIANPIVRAADGDQAAAYIEGTGAYTDRQRHPLPALVLLDLKLPRRSGFEVLDAIRAHPPSRHVPVVVLTSSSQQADVERAYERGANSFLVKPVSRDTLLDMVRTLEAYWIGFNRGAAA
jgi:CheY-like chemotaxis protein